MSKISGKHSSKKQSQSDGEYKYSILEKRISELERSENAFIETVKEIQNRYEYVINNISEIIFQTDKDGYFIFLSSVWDITTGFSFAESIGSNIIDFIHDNDKEGFRREYYGLLGRKTGSLVFEVRLKTKDREYIWTEIRLQLTYSPDGILLGTTGTINDIDSRKKNFSELQYRLMFERIIMDISSELMNFDPEELESKIFHALRLICEISGYDSIYLSLFSIDYSAIEHSFLWELSTGRSERKGKQLLPENSGLLRQLLGLETIFHNNISDLDFKQKKELLKYGNKNETSLLIIPLVFNRVLTGFIRFDSSQVVNKYDNERLSLIRTSGEIMISAFKRMEIQKALSESESNYSLVVNNIKEVIFKLNRTGELNFLNKAWSDLTGFGYQESISVSFLIFIYPEDRQNNLDSFKNIITQKYDSIRYTTRMITRNGSYRWVEIFMNAVINKGSIAGISGTITDITERKQSETLQKALYETAVLTAGINNNDKFYSSLHKILIDLMDARNFCFILFNSQKEELSFPYFNNIKCQKPADRALGYGLLDLVFRKHNPILVAQENRYQIIHENILEEWEKGFVDFLAIPLIRDLEIIGAIAVYNYDENIRYNENHLDILSTVARHIINTFRR